MARAQSSDEPEEVVGRHSSSAGMARTVELSAERRRRRGGRGENFMVARFGLLLFVEVDGSTIVNDWDRGEVSDAVEFLMSCAYMILIGWLFPIGNIVLHYLKVEFHAALLVDGVVLY